MHATEEVQVSFGHQQVQVEGGRVTMHVQIELDFAARPSSFGCKCERGWRPWACTRASYGCWRCGGRHAEGVGEEKSKGQGRGDEAEGGEGDAGGLHAQHPNKISLLRRFTLINTFPKQPLPDVLCHGPQPLVADPLPVDTSHIVPGVAHDVTHRGEIPPLSADSLERVP